MAGRFGSIVPLLGDDLWARVQVARVLVVGAGGIGCELLKNLVLTGFADIEVVDLDTIDVSNLNRQFLFRPHHVNKPKAEVAKESVLAFFAETAASSSSSSSSSSSHPPPLPPPRIVAHHANIKDPAYGISFFEKFDIVIDALDNVSARKHVNRLCLAANKPLIEAGTQGYLGQAFVIKKGVTECFECQPKPVQKAFPICTIRSTPDKPVHCVVWAKELHKLLLGNAKDSSLYEETTGGTEAGAGGATGAASSSSSSSPPSARDESVYMHLVRPEAFPRGEGSSAPSEAGCEAYARAVFTAVFHDEIKKRLEIAPEVYKAAAKQPEPLDLTKIEGGATAAAAASSASSSSSSSSSHHARAPLSLPDQRVPTLAECASLFVASLSGFHSDPSLASTLGARSFSKDSPEDLDFVTAATNLRAYTFGIPLQSRFDVKSIAGNIIPAIATTNAIVAGLEVIEALKILKGLPILEACRYTWCQRVPSSRRRQLLQPTKLYPPNPACFVCGAQGVTVFLDTEKTALKEFIEKVLKGALNFVCPNVNTAGGFDFVDMRLDYEEEDEYQQKMGWMPLPIASLVGGGLKDGTIADITEFSEDHKMHITLTIRHRAKEEFDEMKHPSFFEIAGQASAAEVAETLEKEAQAVKKAASELKAQAAGGGAAAGSEPLIAVVAAAGGGGGGGGGGAAGGASAGVGKKRSREEDGDEGEGDGGAKRMTAEEGKAAAAPTSGSGVIELLSEDEADGAEGGATGGKGGGGGGGGGGAPAAAAQEGDNVEDGVIVLE